MWSLRNWYSSSLTVCFGTAQVCPKVGVACLQSPADGNLSVFLCGAHCSWLLKHSSSIFWSRGFLLNTLMGCGQTLVVLTALIYTTPWPFDCRHLKSETDLQNAQFKFYLLTVSVVTLLSVCGSRKVQLAASFSYWLWVVLTFLDLFWLVWIPFNIIHWWRFKTTKETK